LEGAVEINRRDLLWKSLAIGVVKLGPGLSAAGAVEAWLRAEKGKVAATPIDQLGPFYKKGTPKSAAHSATMRMAGDPGLPLAVTGAVYNTRGDALPDAKIEIWQSDHRGDYDINGYRYRALLLSGAKGEYDCETVLPGHYPARKCQHIHFLVQAKGHKTLVTQMYFGSDPVFKGDPAKNMNDDCPSIELVRPVLLIDQPNTMSASATFELVMETL
jgi:protocatechuate 3,4-dioxygenase beta subunit